MSRRTLACLGVVLLFLPHQAVCEDSEPTAADLTLSISSPKATIAMYEPLIVSFSIVNATSRTIPAKINMSSLMVFIRAESGGREIRYRSGPVGSQFVLETMHPPGDTKEGLKVLFWNDKTDSLAFPQVGRYVLSARMLVGRAPQIFVDAIEPLTISVVQPAGENQAALRFFDDEKSLVTLLADGPRQFCRDAPHPSCFEELRGFVREHGQSAYAPHACYILANGVAAGLLDVTPSTDLAIGLAEEFLRQWPDHSLARIVMKFLIHTLDSAGRQEDALARIAEFEERWPKRTDAAALLRYHVLDGQEP